MNDYLWDKSGKDNEIEGLENMLSSLKYRPIAPPALPVTVKLTSPVTAPWWKFSLAFSVPACLLIAVLGGFWMTRPTPKSQNVSQQINHEPTTTGPPQIDSVETTPELKRSEPEIANEVPPKTVRTVFITKPKKSTKNIIHASHRKQPQKFETLTSEERFAYDQLMLALSITGSKLKVVSDAVNRTED